MIHQSKSWYYLGAFQTSRMELFVKIVFDYITDESETSSEIYKLNLLFGNTCIKGSF